jgi:hypothetical protein
MKDKQTVYYTYYGPRHREGTYSFMMEWWQENHHSGPSWRGQMFRADPKPYQERQKELGLKIVEEQRDAL